MTVNNAYKIYRQSHLNPREYRLDTFAEPLLMRTTPCIERVCRLKHYSQVVAVHITLREIFSLTVSINGLPKTHSNGIAHQDVKEHQYIIAKKCNVGLHAECFELYHCK